jgi:hypothetical protein
VPHPQTAATPGIGLLARLFLTIQQHSGSSVLEVVILTDFGVQERDSTPHKGAAHFALSHRLVMNRGRYLGHEALSCDRHEELIGEGARRPTLRTVAGRRVWPGQTDAARVCWVGCLRERPQLTCAAD